MFTLSGTQYLMLLLVFVPGAIFAWAINASLPRWIRRMWSRVTRRRGGRPLK